VDAREKRLAQNETLFREINERVNELAARHGTDGHLYTYFCECSNPDCTLQLELTNLTYEAVRAHSARFIVAPGHEMPGIETVIERSDSWWLVEKYDETAEFAEELDPRDND